jgi:hypothetical protein
MQWLICLKLLRRPASPCDRRLRERGSGQRIAGFLEMSLLEANCLFVRDLADGM